MAKYGNCWRCGVLWVSAWTTNNRRYCTDTCRKEASRDRRKLNGQSNEWRKEKKKIRNRKTQGRLCKWPHCRVDDTHHIESWNAPSDTCPSCYRQGQRVISCSRCGGPKYHHPHCNRLYCPSCEPREAKAGEVSVTLVCLATGKERQLVKRRNWKLSDGTRLSDVQDDGFAVIDVAPKVWARYRT
jgi:hypothetical protein